MFSLVYEFCFQRSLVRNLKNFYIFSGRKFSLRVVIRWKPMSFQKSMQQKEILTHVVLDNGL